jgi:uncharacterized integral membrane protein
MRPGSDRKVSNTAMPTLRAMKISLVSFWHRGRAVERIGYLVGAVLLASGLIHFTLLAIGGGSWAGPLSLRKPTTFGLSFGLTLITVTWVTSFLRLRDRARKTILGVFTAACALETALVSLQTWRGVPSHFNVETTFDAFVTRGLAGGGVTLVIAILMLSVIAFRSNPAVPPSMRLAIQVGFLTLLAAQIIGGVMIARGMILVFRGAAQTAYATGGMLKPTHAVTMHAILILPALAWLISFVDWSERRRERVVRLASLGYVVLATVIAVGNVAGVDLSHLPGVMAAPLAVGALLLVATGGLTLLALGRDPAHDGIQHH